MSLGFSNIRDLVDVLLVPLSAALLAVMWPFFTARNRQRNFEDLIRRELQEAAPASPDPDLLWHEHLPRKFLHQDIINDPVANTEFLLSLDPSLIYYVSQMWKAFDEAVGLQHRGQPVGDQARQFCEYLQPAAKYLDGHRRRSQRRSAGLVETVWQPWHDLIVARYPSPGAGATRG